MKASSFAYGKLSLFEICESAEVSTGLSERVVQCLVCGHSEVRSLSHSESFRVNIGIRKILVITEHASRCAEIFA